MTLKTLPYDGITRTGSKGVSHSAPLLGEDPHVKCERYWKDRSKASHFGKFRLVQFDTLTTGLIYCVLDKEGTDQVAIPVEADVRTMDSSVFPYKKTAKGTKA